MLAKLLGYATRLLALKQQTEWNTAEIRELRQEVKALAEIVRQLQTDLLLSQQKADADTIQQSLQQKIGKICVLGWNHNLMLGSSDLCISSGLSRRRAETQRTHHTNVAPSLPNACFGCIPA